MDASKIYNELISEVRLLLNEKGFSHEDGCFYFRKDANWGLLEFQKSRKSTAGEIIFTINLGICSTRLLEFFSPELVGRKPSIQACHWRERIGFLLLERQDKWWIIRPTEPLNSILGEIKDCLSQVAVPAIGRHLSDMQLAREWLSGKSPGLTDIQRLMNLSVLLKAEGENNIFHGIRKELEEKSAGKPSATIVKMHLQNLERVKSNNGA